MSGLLFSPYKDVTINMNWNTYQMQSAVEGSDLPVVGSGSLVSQYIPKLPAITLAFATGSCGSETWGGAPAASWAAENIPQLHNANLNYVVSTGGAGRDLHLRLDRWHGIVHRPLRQPEPGRH